jgi:hypothetical protein
MHSARYHDADLTRELCARVLIMFASSQTADREVYATSPENDRPTYDRKYNNCYQSDTTYLLN